MLFRLGSRSTAYARYQLHIVPAISVFCFLLLLLSKIYSGNIRLGQFLTDSGLPPRQAAANTTLGVSVAKFSRHRLLNFHLQFQKLLVPSSEPGWRTRGIQAAANLTGIHFTIPPQHNPEELIAAFEDIGLGSATTPEHGSASAWVARLDMLKYIIASGLETAFIVEDDVDWDVRIKDQIQLISDNVRNYTKCPDSDSAPYGTDCDVLWLGHCGSIIEDWIPAPRIYADHTRIPTDQYASFSTGSLRDHLPEGYRQIQVSTLTVCIFGYGVTEDSAQKILTLLARGADEAFDVALSQKCREKELRCLVMNPQIMNH